MNTVEVFLLEYSYDYGEDDEHTFISIIGLFSSYENAKKKRNEISKDSLNLIDYYKIYPVTINDVEWKEGFVKWTE